VLKGEIEQAGEAGVEIVPAQPVHPAGALVPLVDHAGVLATVAGLLPAVQFFALVVAVLCLAVLLVLVGRGRRLTSHRLAGDGPRSRSTP
jgi:hypothetical protein